MSVSAHASISCLHGSILLSDDRAVLCARGVQLTVGLAELQQLFADARCEPVDAFGWQRRTAQLAGVEVQVTVCDLCQDGRYAPWSEISVCGQGCRCTLMLDTYAMSQLSV